MSPVPALIMDKILIFFVVALKLQNFCDVERTTVKCPYEIIQIKFPGLVADMMMIQLMIYEE